MRTVRSSGRLSRGVSAPRGVPAPGGVSAPRGRVCSRGCLLGGGCLLGVGGGGGIPACTEADTPPVDRQMPVKT